MTFEGLLDRLLRHLTIEHPLPWRIETDWTCEVTAADGFVIVKCPKYDEARAFIARAEELARKADHDGELIERELALMDEDTRLGRTNRCRYFGCPNPATHEDLVESRDAFVSEAQPMDELAYTVCCADHAGPRAQLLGTVPSLHPPVELS